MYGALGRSAPSLHRESTDSLIIAQLIDIILDLMGFVRKVFFIFPSQIILIPIVMLSQ